MVQGQTLTRLESSLTPTAVPMYLSLVPALPPVKHGYGRSRLRGAPSTFDRAILHRTGSTGSPRSRGLATGGSYTPPKVLRTDYSRYVVAVSFHNFRFPMQSNYY